MVQSQYSLTWETFKTSVCGGFSSLQQNGELVDMTLAADGHFVKVHQVLMALVSPYLKGLITSAPCQHPVIFLNNVSHQTLGQLLEYVYTGEVMVPFENFQSFIQTGKALRIKGLDDVGQDNNQIVTEHNLPHLDEGFGNTTNTSTTNTRLSSLKRMADDRSSIPSNAKRIILTRNPHGPPYLVQHEQTVQQPDESSDFLPMPDNDTDDDLPISEYKQGPSDSKHSANAATSVQFSISIRGCLQVILNRYIYNLHSTQLRKGVKRWRCVNYRDHRCQAYLITKGNVVQSRANPHNHPFHDQKILQKIEKKAIFTALEDVETYQEKQKKEESENTVTELTDRNMKSEKSDLDIDLDG